MPSGFTWVGDCALLHLLPWHLFKLTINCNFPFVQKSHTNYARQTNFVFITGYQISVVRLLSKLTRSLSKKGRFNFCLIVNYSADCKRQWDSYCKNSFCFEKLGSDLDVLACATRLQPMDTNIFHLTKFNFCLIVNYSADCKRQWDSYCKNSFCFEKLGSDLDVLACATRLQPMDTNIFHLTKFFNHLLSVYCGGCFSLQLT